ncbi:MAG: hypothetical protein ACOC9V_06850 [Chloroflexota bacterium]
MTAYDIILILHNVLRWVVLLAGAAAVIRALAGWLGNRDWAPLDKQLGLLFTISLDLQVLLGLLLYVVLSPITTENFSNFGEAMGNADVRFYLVEHLAIMIVALALAHVGRAMSKRVEPANAKHMRAAIFFALALVAILVGIPWEGRPLLRLG